MYSGALHSREMISLWYPFQVRGRAGFLRQNNQFNCNAIGEERSEGEQENLEC